MAAWVIWFIIAGILFIAEMLSITFYMLWLGIGAVVGGLIALFVPEALLLQVVVGAIVSLTLTFFTKRISKNFREAKGFTDTVDMLAGKKGIVMQAITNEVNGIVKVDGGTWTAVADNPIDAGEKIVVIKRHSTILQVKRESE
ncbi:MULTISPECIES: NfeD family protein [Bacillus]|uniref:NfeD family protein n=2 Tax=Bacillus cereus group TaxID=86661 RepID=A0A2B0XN64_BACAN|nr:MULTISPECIES: NfeD family protein [Bacillus]KZD35530.1 putative activity regulator of membrane protease YbbK [Bacillus cereus]MBJ8060311.1 NfeD family protein [Bacillus cereus]MCU4756888.1 NfeD family protein [Bacillus cereus]MCU5105733.1 NfeD family protein [Bacillus cereus]MCU5340468.1 NfeD family protein [Bacillus cereus]